jgi:hypothetical protein
VLISSLLFSCSHTFGIIMIIALMHSDASLVRKLNSIGRTDVSSVDNGNCYFLPEGESVDDHHSIDALEGGSVEKDNSIDALDVEIVGKCNSIGVPEGVVGQKHHSIVRLRDIRGGDQKSFYRSPVVAPQIRSFLAAI